MLPSKDLVSTSVKYGCITPKKHITRLFGASDFVFVSLTRHRLPNTFLADGITYIYSHCVPEIQAMVCTGILDAV